MDRFLSTDEVAEILSVHPDTVRDLIKSRAIASLRIGRKWRIRQSALDAYIQRHERRAIEPASILRIRRKAA